MKILMVCLGNICRSPLAQGILEQKIRENQLDWSVDSAGTSGWHIGESPHKGSIAIAHENGIKISHQKARKFISKDFEMFDLILAMDSENYRNIIAISPDERLNNKVKLLLNYSYPNMNMAVPDPYYTGGFDKVFRLIDEACDELLKKHKA